MAGLFFKDHSGVRISSYSPAEKWNVNEQQTVGSAAQKKAMTWPVNMINKRRQLNKTI